MKQFLFFALVLLSFSSRSFSQEFPTINKEKLKEYISQDSEHDFFMVTIFTNGCGSINYLNQNDQLVDSITGGRTRHFLCQSTNGKDRGAELKTVLAKKELPEGNVYVIDQEKYRFNKKDARAQGMLFRDEISSESKFVEIGVAYKIILDKQMNVLYYGLLLKPEDIAAIFRCK